MEGRLFMKNDFIFKKKKTPGLVPGEILIEKDMKKPKITVTDYDEKDASISNFDYASEAYNLILNQKHLSSIPSGKTRWIDIQGFGDKSLFEILKSEFNIHPLVIEDILNPMHRAKVDFFEGYCFLILKFLAFDAQNGLINKQISFLCGKNYVLTFQEDESSLFKPISERICLKNGIIRKMKADYLSYALMDVIFDHYFQLIENISSYIEDIEEKININAKQEELMDVQTAKHLLISLKRELWPIMELTSKLLRENSVFFSDQVKIYLKDLFDHIKQTLEFTESLKELTSSLINTFLTVQGNKLNEIMKVLTIISTIFIPLSFLAGLYGMNFKFIPELETEYGYFVLLSVMGFIAFIMLMLFKKIGWLGKKRHSVLKKEDENKKTLS